MWWCVQVVLPAGNLQDMMRSVISNDEKMQEATVSIEGGREGGRGVTEREGEGKREVGREREGERERGGGGGGEGRGRGREKGSVKRGRTIKRGREVWDDIATYTCGHVFVSMYMCLW